MLRLPLTLLSALILTLLLAASAACSGDAERVRELEGQLTASEQQRADALAEVELQRQAAAADGERIEELEAELARIWNLLADELEPPEAEARSTLREVLERGELNCGVKWTQPLFGLRTADGTIEGFDIEFCKAIAAAVLDDPDAVHYVDASDASIRFLLLAHGEIDVLIRTTTVTASRDADLGVDFVQPTFYGGQGFAVRADSAYRSTLDMTDNPTICVLEGTTTERNLSAHFQQIGLEYTPLPLADPEEFEAFFAGRCDVWTADQTAIMSLISTLEEPGDYRVLTQAISKEPMAAVVRDDDPRWRDIVHWVVHGLIAAEELGVTAANVADYAADPPDIHIARLLAAPFGDRPAADFGFAHDPQFVRRAIAAVGNYGEIYERTLAHILPRPCTFNALASEDKSRCPPGTGGILYALPYR